MHRAPIDKAFVQRRTGEPYELLCLPTHTCCTQASALVPQNTSLADRFSDRLSPTLSSYLLISIPFPVARLDPLLSPMGEKSVNYQPNSDEALKLSIEEDDHDRRPDTTAAKSSNKEFLKYVSLVTLTIQNASLTLFMRAARTQRELFISSTAVIMAEILKLLTCLVMVYKDEG